MRFKVDENLPDEFAGILRDAGWDAHTVREQQLAGKADPQVADVCRRERRVLVTLDVGFGDIRTYPPDDYAGVIVLRLENQGKESALSVGSRIITALRDRPIDAELWIVDERRIRIRAAR